MADYQYLTGVHAVGGAYAITFKDVTVAPDTWYTLSSFINISPATEQIDFGSLANNGNTFFITFSDSRFGGSGPSDGMKTEWTYFGTTIKSSSYGSLIGYNETLANDPDFAEHYPSGGSTVPPEQPSPNTSPPSEVKIQFTAAYLQTASQSHLSTWELIGKPELDNVFLVGRHYDFTGNDLHYDQYSARFFWHTEFAQTGTVTYNIGNGVTITADKASVTEGAYKTPQPVTYTVSRTGDVSGALAVSWEVANRSPENFFYHVQGAANEFDYSIPAGQTFTPELGRGVLQWIAGDSAPKTITLNVIGDAQPERSEDLVVRISTTTPNVTIANDTAKTKILDDDGIRNAETLLFWAFNHPTVTQGAALPETMPGAAHSLINDERNYDSQDFDLLVATRYAWGVKLGVGDLLDQAAGLIITAYIVPVDGIKWPLKILTYFGADQFEKALLTGPQMMSWPSITADEAFGTGYIHAFTGAWKYYLAPAPAPAPQASEMDLFAPPAAPTIIYMRAADTKTSTVTFNGVTYTLISGPTLPVNDDGMFVFDTIDNTLLQTGAGNDQIFSARENAHIQSGAGDDLITVRDSGSTIDAGAGNDVVVGGDGVDIVTAGSGNDVLVLGGGNDQVDGGDGLDTMVFSGNRAAYTITRGASSVTVDGPDGSDTLVSVERLTFADATIALKPAQNDFNGDGRMDVLFSQPGAIYASNYEWQMNDRAISAQGAIDLYDPAFTVQVVGDYDGDGKSDVVFQNPTTGGVWMWRLDGTAIVSQGAVDVADPSYHLLGSADFNGDGKSDLLFRNDTGFVYMWRMDGRADTPLPVQALDPAWHVQGAGDFDGDGKADILLRNIGSDPNENGAFYLWKMDGNVVTGGGGIERPPTEWKTLGLGDFDGDGKTDFAVRNVSDTGDNGAVWVYLMDGTTIKSQGAAGIADPNTWHVQQIGDLNGDGKDDILFRNDAGYFYSWDMNGTTIASEGLAGTEAGNWADPSLKVVTQHFDLI